MTDKMISNYREWCRVQLAGLSRRHWAAFAASCAERQFGTYIHFSNIEPALEPRVLRDAIDLGWAYASGEELAHGELVTLKEQVDALIPNLDESPSAFASLILDAVGSASSLLAVCMDGRVDDVVEAGECARNAVDEWVIGILFQAADGELKPITIRPEEQAALQMRVNSHPLMQREMRQQQSDIAYLRGHTVLGRQECLLLRQSWPNGIKSNLDLGAE